MEFPIAACPVTGHPKQSLGLSPFLLPSGIYTHGQDPPLSLLLAEQSLRMLQTLNHPRGLSGLAPLRPCLLYWEPRAGPIAPAVASPRPRREAGPRPSTCRRCSSRGHIAGSCSAWHPPAHPGPFLPNHFPAEQPPQHLLVQGFVPLRGRTWHCPLLTFTRSPPTHFSNPAHPSDPVGCYQPLPSVAYHQQITESVLCPSLRHRTKMLSGTGPSTHPRGTPPVPDRQLDSAPLTTTLPGQPLLRPPHLRVPGYFQEASHPSFQIRRDGAGSGGSGHGPFIYSGRVLC